MQRAEARSSPLVILLAALVVSARAPDPAHGLPNERSSIERTYELTKYLEHQLREIKDTYLSYLGPPFSDPDFSPPRPNTTALSLPSAATRLDLWRGLENRARLVQNHRAYSVLLGAVKELAQATLCPYLQSSLLHFSVGLDGLLGSISGLMATLGYALPPHYYSAQTGDAVDASFLTPGYYSSQPKSTVVPEPAPLGRRYPQNFPAKGGTEGRPKEVRKGQRGRDKENERGPHRDPVAASERDRDGGINNNQRPKDRGGKQTGDKEGRVGEAQREGRGGAGKPGEMTGEEETEGWRKRRRLLSISEEGREEGSGSWNSETGSGDRGLQESFSKASEQRPRVRTRVVSVWPEQLHDLPSRAVLLHSSYDRITEGHPQYSRVEFGVVELGAGGELTPISPSSPVPRHRSPRSVPSSLYTSTLHPPLSPFSLLYQLGTREGHTLLGGLAHGSPLPALASLSAPPLLPATALNDFSRKVESFWVLRELQSWLWRSAKDFNRLKKRLRA